MVVDRRNRAGHTYGNIVAGIEQKFALRIVLDQRFVFEYEVLEIDWFHQQVLVLRNKNSCIEMIP